MRVRTGVLTAVALAGMLGAESSVGDGSGCSFTAGRRSARFGSGRGSRGAGQQFCIRRREEDLHRSRGNQGPAAVAQRHQHQKRQAGRWRLSRLDLSGCGGKQGDDSRRCLRAGRGRPRGPRRTREGQGAARYALHLDHLPQWNGGGDSRPGEQPARRAETDQ